MESVIIQSARHGHPLVTFTCSPGRVQDAAGFLTRSNGFPCSLQTCCSFAPHLLKDGVDIRCIQELVGHTGIETTERYAHMTQKGMERKGPLDKVVGGGDARYLTRSKWENLDSWTRWFVR